MHSYLIGQSRTGKSTLLEQLILDTEGGFCLLDPHGTLAEAVADRTQCLYFNPFPIGLNVLKDVPFLKRHLITENVVSIFRKIWAESWGPRMEYILRHSVRLLIDNNKTLLDIPPLLTNESFRNRCLRRAAFPDFWHDEFAKWDDRYRNDAIAPVLNKVGQFTLDPVLRDALTRKPLSFVRLMNTHKKIVVNLAKPKLGETPSRLLGALLVSSIYQAAQASNREPFTLFADEFQNFATDDFADILSEAGKFGLSLCVAHQFLGQLSEPLRQAVFGNISTLTSFRISPEDADVVGRAMDRPDLQDLPNYQYWTNAHHPPAPRRNETLPSSEGLRMLASNSTRTRNWYP
jgi:hypothetical protein